MLENETHTHRTKHKYVKVHLTKQNDKKFHSKLHQNETEKTNTVKFITGRHQRRAGWQYETK